MDEPEQRRSEQQFVWRHGRSEVTLRRQGESWTVTYTVTGRLLGPRQVLYEKHHQRATHAAWDVMARVIRASRNEAEAMRAAQDAARWIRSTSRVDDRDTDL